MVYTNVLTSEGNVTRRRRKCRGCGARWTTFEVIELSLRDEQLLARLGRGFDAELTAVSLSFADPLEDVLEQKRAMELRR